MTDASGSGPEWTSSLLDGLDPQQCAAVTAPRGPVCVLAGAGTGKTRTITHRIAHLVRSGHVDPGQVLAVTFTSRAAGELRARLETLGVYGAQARTFHAAALRQLRYFWPRAVGDSRWQLLDSKSHAVGRAAHRVGLRTDGDTVRDLAAEIEWAKASLVDAADYPSAVGRHRRDPPAPAAEVARVYRTYEDLKNSAEMLDFADLLLHTIAVLEEHSAVAEEFRDRYRCFVVDEYQDVTPLQQRLLDAWLGDRDDLTVVGDANQTIYSFAGASAQPLLDFTRRFPAAELVRLERDYRSSPQVVGLANTVIDAARSRPAGARLRLRGERENGPHPRFGEYDDEPAEAAAVAERVTELLAAGVDASEIAVLFRVNAQSEVYEEALAARGVAYLVRGGERFFERAEIRKAMAAVRTAAASRTSTGRDGLVSTVRECLRDLGLTDTPPESGTSRQRWEALDALVGLARQYTQAAPDPASVSLAGYVAELEARAAAQHPPTLAGVTLASLHAAKGLEWDAVFLVGLTDGTLPIQQARDSAEAIEEERRLFYVGVTRAREHLWLSWALSRTPGGRARRRSRFLHGVAPESPAQRSGTGRTGRAEQARCRVCGSGVTTTREVKLGRCARCPADLDEDLLARLRQWRARRAEELRIPVYAVFTDATLQAIAEQQPVDDRSLVGISGVGATKLSRFGAEVLEVLRESGRRQR